MENSLGESKERELEERVSKLERWVNCKTSLRNIKRKRKKENGQNVKDLWDSSKCVPTYA